MGVDVHHSDKIYPPYRPNTNHLQTKSKQLYSITLRYPLRLVTPPNCVMPGTKMHSYWLLEHDNPNFMDSRSEIPQRNQCSQSHSGSQPKQSGPITMPDHSGSQLLHIRVAGRCLQHSGRLKKPSLSAIVYTGRFLPMFTSSRLCTSQRLVHRWL
jgi:hypothetical protein